MSAAAWVLLGDRGTWVNVDAIESVGPNNPASFGSQIRTRSGDTHLDLRKPEEILDQIRAAHDAQAKARPSSVPIATTPDEDEPFVSPIRIDPTKGPHSRACGIQRHDHGRDCSSNCPTCKGRTAEQRLQDIKERAQQHTSGSRTAAEIINQLRGEQGRETHQVSITDLPRGRHLSVVEDPAPRSKDVLPTAASAGTSYWSMGKLAKVNRVTVVPSDGKVYERYDAFEHGAYLELQDDGQTLKVFPLPAPKDES